MTFQTKGAADKNGLETLRVNKALESIPEGAFRLRMCHK